MSQPRSRPAEARHGDDADNVLAGQSKDIARKHSATFIPIDAQHAIGADSHSWHILQRRRYKGGYRWEPIAWYTTLEQCVNGFTNSAVRLSGAQTLAELSAESQRVTSVVCRALQPHFIVERRP